MPRKWLSIALLNFFLAGCLGVLMRFAFVSEVSWMDYRYIMHAHSHMAMLGWLYLSLFILLVSYFLDAHQQSKSIYKRLFALTQIAVIGMFLSFPFQGYGLYSITFSTLHILLSYAFAYRFIKDLGSNGDHHFASLLFVKSALGLMIISTFALFAMAPVMASEMKQSAWYYGLVQFFLHFQFNGWYIFGILSLSFRLLEYWNIIIPKRKVIIFYSLLLFSCLFTFALAVTWSTPVSGLFWINSLGVSLQFLALVYLFRMLKPYYSSIRRKLQGWILALFSIAVLSFIMKIVVQSAVVIPYIATVAYTIRLYVIGFIHLILLACITAAVFAFASYKMWIDIRSRWIRTGLTLLFIGIALSEMLLFAQGTMFWSGQGFIPFYYVLIFAVSILIPLGVLIILWKSISSIK